MKVIVKRQKITAANNRKSNIAARPVSPVRYENLYNLNFTTRTSKMIETLFNIYKSYITVPRPEEFQIYTTSELRLIVYFKCKLETV